MYSCAVEIWGAQHSYLRIRAAKDVSRAREAFMENTPEIMPIAGGSPSGAIQSVCMASTLPCACSPSFVQQQAGRLPQTPFHVHAGFSEHSCLSRCWRS